MNGQERLLKVLSDKAKDRRVAAGRDTEHNLTVRLGRKPHWQELHDAMKAELDAMFAKDKP